MHCVLPTKIRQQTIFLLGHNIIFPYTHTQTYIYIQAMPNVWQRNSRGWIAGTGSCRDTGVCESEREKGSSAFVGTFSLAPGPNICLAPNTRRPPPQSPRSFRSTRARRLAIFSQRLYRAARTRFYYSARQTISIIYITLYECI